MTSNKEAIQRSFVIPVFSPHSPYNIRTLLKDLESIPGEVICIFNSPEVYKEIGDHKRIDKYSFNNLNAGVSRSWNMGINLSEGRAVFILNSDVHVMPKAIEELESYLFSLDKAVVVGPQGALVDFQQLCDLKYFEKNTFDQPVRCHATSGFLFAIHLARFLKYRLMFDIQFSPCFLEEWDMGLQIMQAGLLSYAVPVVGFEHHWGVSANPDMRINFLGKELDRNKILLENREKFKAKWFPILLQNDLGQINRTEKKEVTPAPVPEGIKRLEIFIEKIQGQAYPETPSALHSQITQQMLERCLSKITLSNESRILDVGCGQGPALDLFKAKGYKAVGITINDDDVRACVAKGHEVYKMDQSFLNFPQESFDFVWARHCIEHSIFPFFTLSEFYYVLRQGAYLYLEVPAPNTSCHHETNLNHYSVLTDSMWASLIERGGFELVERVKLSFNVVAGPDEYWAFICRKPILQTH